MCVVLAGVGGPSAAAAATGCGAKQDDALLVCLVDAARRGAGVRPLTPSPLLQRAARLKAQQIRRCGQFSHTPCGQRFLSAYAAAGFPVGRRSLGENLAWGQGSLGTPAAVLGGWLRSPPHRRNLLNPGYRVVGVASLRLTRFLGLPNVRLWVASFAD